VKLAVEPFNTTVPSRLVPSVNWTCPVGVAKLELTFAMKVTLVPGIILCPEAERVNVEGYPTATKAMSELLPT
jgi:hypothetical protein